MERIVQKLNTLSNFELETRIHLDPDSWKELILLILNSGDTKPEKTSMTSKIEQSVQVLIKSNTYTDRCEIFFDKGIKKQEVSVRKTSLEKYKNQLYNKPYTVSLATETTISKPNIALAHKVRIKLRLSLLMPSSPIGGDWRIDFTFVKTLDKSQFQKELQSIIKEIFKPNVDIKPNNYLEYLSTLKYNKLDSQVSYEFELEYVGKAKPTEETIRSSILATMMVMDPGIERSSKYHKALYPIALMLLREQGTEYAEIFKYKYTLKQLVNQPKNFSVEEYFKYILPNIDNYYLSDKADGERCIIYFDKVDVFIIGSDTVTCVTKQLHKEELGKFTGEVILDAEVLDFRPNTEKTFSKIYLFDVMMDGEKTTSLPFEAREKKLDDIAKYLGTTFEKKIQMRLSKDYPAIIKEVYNRGSRLYPIDGLIFTPAHIVEKDGKNTKYDRAENYFDMVVYKWKPVEKLTIDFLVMKPPASLLGISPYLTKDGFDMYFLFCGIKPKLLELLNLNKVKNYYDIFSGFKFNQNYFPIQFSPSSNPHAYIYYHPQSSPIKESELHGHTVEFGYNCFPEGTDIDKTDIDKTDIDKKGKGKEKEVDKEKKINKDSNKDDNNNEIVSREDRIKGNQCWYIHKLRPDKDVNVARGTEYGNNFKVAESTYQTYQNPVTLEVLMSSKTSDVYFKNPKQLIYKALTKYNGFVKAQVIRQLENTDWVIDPTAGKGQDLFVYSGYEIKNGLMMDIDKDAIEELNKRKYSLDKPEFYVHAEKPKTRMSIFTRIGDLREPYNKIIESLQDVPLPPKGVDGVVMNFSLHYIVDTAESLDNLVNFVDSLLKPGGLFIFTCFDGNKIFNILKSIDRDKAWELREGEVVKYSIIKKYQEETLADFGQKISVIHPFSDGEHYEENLINIPIIIKTFVEKKYEVRQNSSFAEWLGKYKNYDRKNYNALSKEDILYSALYSYVTLWKPVAESKKEKKNQNAGVKRTERLVK
jgi:SAM-dependent methyltransferase